MTILKGYSGSSWQPVLVGAQELTDTQSLNVTKSYFIYTIYKDIYELSI